MSHERDKRREHQKPPVNEPGSSMLPRTVTEESPPPVQPPAPPVALKPAQFASPPAVVHQGITQFLPGKTPLRGLVITNGDEIVMKLGWGCGVGDVNGLIHALRDRFMTDPPSVFQAMLAFGFGCRNCMTLLTPKDRIGPHPEPEKPDAGRLAYRDPNVYVDGKPGKLLTISMTSEFEHAARVAFAKRKGST